jgi:glycosyltransferase involved in cell wall biosynthesis
MRACLLGHISDQLDEGMKNTGIMLSEHLGTAGVEARLFDLREVTTPRFWTGIRRYDPDVVHLVHGPSIQGLLLLELLSTMLGCRTVATSTQPRFGDLSWRVAGHLRPDRVLVQSGEDESLFGDAGFHTEYVPSGVDVDRFHPVDDEERGAIREDLGLNLDELVFLHVGHFKEGRNLRSLLSLREYGQVVVVGSPSTGPRETLIEDLRTAGCVARTEYVPDIERYYQTADWYVFPVVDESNSIRAPLSVLEAMACNLPVLSTRFGGLSDMFEEGEGLVYVSDVSAVDIDTITDPEPIRTRQKVEPYSWESIAEQVAEIYEELCNEEH